MQGRTNAGIIGFVTFTETCPPTTNCLSGLSAAGHLTRIHEVVPRWLAGELQALGLDQLVDHSPLHYAIRVWNAYAQSR